eukprot:5753856-Amphidinium_carterae.2
MSFGTNPNLQGLEAGEWGHRGAGCAAGREFIHVRMEFRVLPVFDTCTVSGTPQNNTNTNTSKLGQTKGLYICTSMLLLLSCSKSASSYPPLRTSATDESFHHPYNRQTRYTSKHAL